MLRPADQALVDRDPLLAGLAVLLDDDQLTGWLSREMGGQPGAPVEVRPRYLRYKPGTSCVLAAEVGSGDGTRPVLLHAYAPQSSSKLAKSLERAPKGSVLGREPVRGLLATTPAADRDLPGLAALADDRRRRRLLRHVLGDQEDLCAASLQTLRLKPNRRWVGLVRPPHGPPAVLRIYRRSRMQAAADTIAAVHTANRGGSILRTPSLLGVDARRGALAVEYLSGRAPADVADFQATGRVLAALHAHPGVPLRPSPPASQARAVRAAARQLRVLLPDLATEVQALADTLSTRLEAMPELRHAIHGDFSPDQVVVDSEGGAALIDLDAARLGDPSVDLACAAASLTRDLVLGEIDAGTRAHRLDALYDGYGAGGVALDEPRLATHEAAHLLRRAGEPFRLRLTADWPDAVRELVRQAGRALPVPRLTGGAR